MDDVLCLHSVVHIVYGRKRRKMLKQRISQQFHSDQGSEFLNETTKLLFLKEVLVKVNKETHEELF